MSSISGNTEGGGSSEITININATTRFSKCLLWASFKLRYPDLLKIQKPLLPSKSSEFSESVSNENMEVETSLGSNSQIVYRAKYKVLKLMNKNSLILPFSVELITPSFGLEGSMSIPPAEHFLYLWTAFGPIELSAQLLAAARDQCSS